MSIRVPERITLKRADEHRLSRPDDHEAGRIIVFRFTSHRRPNLT